MERDVACQQANVELASLLGISRELASTALASGHITVSDDTRQTFLRLRDMYQVLRQRSRGQGLRATA